MPTPKVLVFTATAGYRHESIPDAIKALEAASSSAGVGFDFTEDGKCFTDDSLSQYDSLMFVSNTGEVLDVEQREAMARYFRNGGGYVGVHSASACLYEDEVYDKVVGAHFDYHPKLQEATFKVLDKDHPSTAHLPDTWRYEEEVYIFRSDPRKSGVHVLMSVEEGSYENTGKSTGDYSSHGDPHPIAWYNANPQSSLPLSPSAGGSGRSFYTSLGHNSSTWADDKFMGHVLGGLSWVLDAKSTRAYGHGCVGNSTTTTTTA